MKTSKLLNKKYLSILIAFLLIFFSNTYAEDVPVDIWDLEKEPKEDSSNLIIEEGSESNQPKTIIEKKRTRGLVLKFDAKIVPNITPVITKPP